MIIANENELVDPIVPVHLSVHEDGVKAVANMMTIMLYLQSSMDANIPSDKILTTLVVMLGMLPNEVV